MNYIRHQTELNLPLFQRTWILDLWNPARKQIEAVSLICAYFWILLATFLAPLVYNLISGSQTLYYQFLLPTSKFSTNKGRLGFFRKTCQEKNLFEVAPRFKYSGAIFPIRFSTDFCWDDLSDSVFKNFCCGTT